MRHAISRTPTSWARSSPISSRSANDKYLPDADFDINNGMPPQCLNHRVPTACDTPTTSAAFSLVIPIATCSQNCRSTSLRSDGAPGDRIAPRPVNFCVHPAGRPINTSMIKVLQRPVECALAALVGVMHQRCGLAPSPQRHHQRINHQLGCHARTHGPAHRTTRVQIQHHRHIRPALSRPDVGEVSPPSVDWARRPQTAGPGCWPQYCVQDVERYPRVAVCVCCVPLAEQPASGGPPGCLIRPRPSPEDRAGRGVSRTYDHWRQSSRGCVSSDVRWSGCAGWANAPPSRSSHWLRLAETLITRHITLTGHTVRCQAMKPYFTTGFSGSSPALFL